MTFSPRARLAPIRRRLKPHLLLGPLLAVVMACGSELGSTEPLDVELEGLSWPDDLLVTEVDTLTVSVQSASGPILSPRLDVRSSDEAVLQLQELVMQEPGPIRVEVRAVGTGVAEIRVDTEDGAPYSGDGLTHPLTVHMKWKTISAGYEHSCGVTHDGVAYCWGGGGVRFLGDGSSAPSAVPVAVVGSFTFGTISAGWGHSCGTLPGGLMLCWGFNQTGALGTGNADDQLAPTRARFGATLSGIGAGFQTTCGISGISTAVCWGDNQYGQLGSALATDTCAGDPCSLSPVAVQSPAQVAARPEIIPLFTAVSAGDRTTCAVSAADFTAHCWGDNTYGLLGTLGVASSDTARMVAAAPTFASVSVGRFHACGLTAGGDAYCWGTSQFGELGTATLSDTCGGRSCSLTPIRINGLPTLEKISVGEHTSCGVAPGGEALCWGLADKGQVGSAAPESCLGLPCARSPLTVPSDGDGYAEISVGRRHVCARTRRGGAFCWGEGSNGKLGHGGAGDAPDPKRVADPPPLP